MLFLLGILLSSASSNEIPDVNCLRSNPEVMDGATTFFKDSNRDLNTTAKDVAESLSLMSTRFKRLHGIFHYDPRTFQVMLEGMSLFKNKSRNDVPMFLFIYPSNKTYEPRLLNETVSRIVELNSAHKSPPIIGFYVNSVITLSNLKLELLDILFGPKELRKLPIGLFTMHCVGNLKKQETFTFMSRLNFYTCFLVPSPKSSPEKTADGVIQKCNEVRDTAASLKFTLDVMCITLYSSQGKDDILGSVDHFQRFWCRITNELNNNQSHARIAMMSAFDDFSNTHSEEDPNKEPDQLELHTGWWRRSSSSEGGWVEKVEELPGGRDYGKCTGECSLCTSSTECCAEMICIPFDPSQQEQPLLICRSRTSNCTKIISSSNSPKNLKPFTIAVISIVGILIGIIVASGFGFLIYRRIHPNLLFSQQELVHFFEGSSSFSPRKIEGDLEILDFVDMLPYDPKMEVAKSTCEIYEDEILGHGAFGVVMKGRVGNKDVAVKTTKPGVNKVYLKALMLELKILMYLGHHENIVNLCGANTSKITSGKLYLFIELCCSGNLVQFLRDNRNTVMEKIGNEVMHNLTPEGNDIKLSCEVILCWSLQIANAMQHLADKKVIHRDIAARNILVFSMDQVKLADFGLSRRLYEQSIYVKSSQEPLPWRHMSVEALRDMSFSTRSDIWAFGVTLWEMFSLGEVPYPGLAWSQDFIKVLSEGLHPLQPLHAHTLVYEVMTSCWTVDVKLRPSITIVSSRLNSAFKELYP